MTNQVVGVPTIQDVFVVPTDKRPSWQQFIVY